MKQSPQLIVGTPLLISRRVVAFLGLSALTICVWLHLRGIGGDFLSDDFGHAHWIAQAYDRGELLDWLVKRFYQPLDSGNYAYRPIVFASYALDWVLYGSKAAGWHTTNLIIHILNSGLVLMLATRLCARAKVEDARFAGVVASTVFVAIPFAGESTFWPVGRFDLLSCTFSLGFLILLLRPPSRPRTGQTAGMITCLLFALLSKESAMPMVAVGFVLVFAFNWVEAHESGRGAQLRATKESVRVYWPVATAAVSYFALRFLIFGSPWKVYPDSHFPKNIGEFLDRVRVLGAVFHYPYGEFAWFWVLLLISIGALWFQGFRSALRNASNACNTLTATLFCCFVVYLLAPASSFPIASDNGEGIRNLYYPWTMFSLFVGFAIAHHRLRVSLLCITLVVAFGGQWRLTTTWQDTAAEMLRVTNAIPALAQTIADTQFALILLPDHVGVVPFVRNAQAGVVARPRQLVSSLPKLAAMTPMQFAEWEQLLGNGDIGKLKGNAPFDRTNFIGVYCWLPQSGRFQLFDAKDQIGQAKAWEASSMGEARRRECLL